MGILNIMLNIFLSGWNTDLRALRRVLWKVSASSSYWPPRPNPVRDTQVKSARKISIRVCGKIFLKITNTECTRRSVGLHVHMTTVA